MPIQLNQMIKLSALCGAESGVNRTPGLGGSIVDSNIQFLPTNSDITQI